MNDVFEHYRSKAADNTDQNTEKNDEKPFRDVFRSPYIKPPQEPFYVFNHEAKLEEFSLWFKKSFCRKTA
jgi:hypothetical protein